MRTRSRRRHIALVPFAFFAALFLSGAEIAPDLRKIDPAVLFRADAGTAAPQGPPGAESAQGAPLSVFIRLAADDAALSEQVRNLGGTAQEVHPRIYAAALPADAPRYLSNRPAVRYIEPDRIARPMLDASGPAVSADLVHQGSPPSLPPFRGDNNTLVGIVDTGLDGTHPDFTGRIAHIFAVSGLNPVQDTNGHGTHVAGIAAGNGAASAGTYTGMAPESWILVGRAGTNEFKESVILQAMNDFISFADAQVPPLPVSINLSLGVTVGPHDGTSSFETAIDSLAAGPSGSRRIISAAAGNERGENEHFRSTVPPFGIVTQNLSFTPGTASVNVEIWADGEDEYTVTAAMGGNSLTVPSGAPGSAGRISISNKVSVHPNGDTLISVNFQPLAGTATASIRLTRTRNGGTGTVDSYIDGLQGTFQGATDAGSVTEPANAENVIAVGSFDTKQHPGGQPDLAEGISAFSSLGPTRDGRVKPDITAPGFVLYSTRSADAPASNYSFGVVDDSYAILAGTSMATAHVTGIAALVWQSNPALTGAQMRERLTRTADPPSDGSTPPNNTWGYGKVNALQAVTESVAGITVVPSAGVSPAAIPPGTTVTLVGNEKSSGPFGQSLSYSWSAGAGGSLGALAGPQTTFTAASPGDYPVSLTVTPGSLPYNLATTALHVNNLPVAQITGPAASDNVGLPADFSGAASFDPVDNQALTLHWILLSRPAGSGVMSLLANGPDNVTLVPDVGGTYEIGLRVDDGLDNSAPATVSFRSGPVPVPLGGGGGGGCSVRIGEGQTDDAAALADILLLIAPLGFLRIYAAARMRDSRRYFPEESADKTPVD